MNRITRRELLAGGLAAASTGAAIAQTQVRASRQRLQSLPTSFSLAERDRRWTRVRAMMKREGFDCLLTPVGTSAEGEADSRYLTQVAGWVVFPLDGRVAVVVNGEDFEDGKVKAAWVSDVRPAERGAWSPPVVDALRELGVTRARGSASDGSRTCSETRTATSHSPRSIARSRRSHRRASRRRTSR